MKMKRGFIGCLLSIFVILTMFSGCNVGSTDGGEADTVLGGGSSVLRIVSGSENSELEPILEEFSDREHVRIEMTYMGSLDIMRLLGEEDIPYDAVWPASSLWLTVGIRNTGSSTRNPSPFRRWCSVSAKAWRRSWDLWGGRCR